MTTFTMVDGLPVWGDPIPDAVAQLSNCAEDEGVVACALMADHHIGYAVPIGGVIAYRGKVSPSGVGYDIACGNKAVRLDVAADHVRANIAEIMDEIWESLSFGVGRKNPDPVEHPLFQDDPAWDIKLVADLRQMAQAQLGTIGSGNHYVDIFVDESDAVWVGVHFGSRGLGHRIATHFVKAGGGKDGMHVKPVLLDADSDLGQQYIAAMRLAGRYAYAGRDWVCDRVAGILNATVQEEVHNHHNFAWLEEHGGEEVWVVRKGATPAFPGQRGFVGGSMGDVSVIVEGVEGEGSDAALYSTVHGAGRVMGRIEAKGKTKYDRSTGETRVIREGRVTPAMMVEWLEAFGGVELRGGGLDESPHAYKRLPEVLAAHSDTIRVLHTLRPIGVAMAGANEFDPFRD